VKSIASREIYVSQNNSSDSKDCGNQLQPCLTIDYAIQTANRSDIILLDVESVFELQNSLEIDKELTISSFSKQRYASTVFPVIKFTFIQTSVFIFSANIHISHLKIVISYSELESIMKLERAAVYTHFENCQILVTAFDYTGVALYRTFQLDQHPRIQIKKSTLNIVHNEIITSRMSASNYTSSDFSVIHGVVVDVLNCTIGYGKLILSSPASVIIKDTTLSDASLVVDAYIECSISSANNTFHNSNLVLNILVSNMISTTVMIESCYFNGSYPNDGLSAQIEMKTDDKNAAFNASVYICDSIFQNSFKGALNLYSNKVIIKNTAFFYNTIINDVRFKLAGRAGALGATLCILEVNNCTFMGNTAPSNFAGSLRLSKMAKPLKRCQVTLENTKLVSGNYPLSSHDTVVISFSEFFNRNTKMECLQNNKLDYYRGSDFLMNCFKCDGTSYNVGHAAYIDWDENYNQHAHNIKCYACPSQASCVDGIRSKGNYWGYANSTGSVKFKHCPSFYCCTSLVTCTSFNTCINNRTGRLCGDCKPGHSISLFGPNKCIETKRCENSFFWEGYVFSIITAFVLLMYNKDMLMYIKNLFKRLTNYTRLPEVNEDQLIPSGTGRYTPYLLLNYENSGNYDGEYAIQELQTSQNTISGILKIAFFFYQTASIIRINAPAKAIYDMSYITDILSSFFNVKIDVASTGVMEVCPILTNNVVIVELFRTSIVLVCLVLFFCAIILSTAITFYYKTKQKRDQFINLQNQTQEMALLNRFKGSYVQLMLLGYASIAIFCFRAVNCIDVNGVSYLYIQAESVECFQNYWQTLVLAVIFCWIVPFPISLYIGCRLLVSRLVTPNQFLFIITFPPSTIAFLIKHVCTTSTISNEIEQNVLLETENILSIMNEPFKFTKQGNRLIWEPVLILRRIILVVTTTFIKSPILKLFPAAFSLILFVVHDNVMCPFSSDALNFIQSVSMQLLCVLTLLNLFWAYSNELDIAHDERLKMVGEYFLYLEIFILLLPLLIAILISFYKLGKFLYKSFCGKQE